MKSFIITVLVLGALGGGGFYYWKTKVAAAEVPKAPTPTAKVEKGQIRLEVPTTGKVVSNLDVDIKCKASGTIIKLTKDVSEHVEPGELLMKLDPVDEERSLKQKKFVLESSKAKLAQAKQNLQVAEMTLTTDTASAKNAIETAQARYDRAQVKYNRLQEASVVSGTITAEELDVAGTDTKLAGVALADAKVHLDEIKTQIQALEVKRLDIKSMESQVDSNEQDVEIQDQRVRDTTVFAPKDQPLNEVPKNEDGQDPASSPKAATQKAETPHNWFVSARNVQEGQIISSAISNVGGGTTALTLSDLSKIFVLASVDESDIGKVDLKQKVLVTADAYPDAKFFGEVSRIATKGVNVSNVVTFEVKIEVTSKNKIKLRPEMTANLTIISAQKDDILKIPAEALIRKKGKRVVTLQKGETTEEREVEVGINDGTSAEIISGLAEGDLVQVKKSDAESKWRGDTSRNPNNPNNRAGGGFNAFGGSSGGGGGGGNRGGGR